MQNTTDTGATENLLFEFIQSDELNIPEAYSDEFLTWLYEKFPQCYIDSSYSEPAPDGDIYRTTDFRDQPCQIISRELRVPEARYLDPISTAVINARWLLEGMIKNGFFIHITDFDSDGNKIIKFDNEYSNENQAYALTILTDENLNIKTFYIYKKQHGENRLLVVDISTNYLSLHMPIAEANEHKKTIQTEIFKMLGHIKAINNKQEGIK